MYHVHVHVYAHEYCLLSSPDMRLMQGDELHLHYVGSQRPPWNGVGHVIKVNNSILRLVYVEPYMCIHVPVVNTVRKSNVKVMSDTFATHCVCGYSS